MADGIQRLLSDLGLALGMPPWMVLLTLVFVVALFFGVGLVLRDRGRLSRQPRDRDPDSLPNLAPELRRARMQMLAAALAMLALIAIAVLNLTGG